MRQTFLSQGVKFLLLSWMDFNQIWKGFLTRTVFLPVSICLFVSLFCLNLSLCFFFCKVLYVCISRSLSISLCLTIFLFILNKVFLSICLSSRLWLYFYEELNLPMPVCLSSCVSVCISVSLLCLSVYVFLFVYLSQLLFPWKKPLSAFTKIFLKLSRNRRFWIEEGNSL